MAKTVLTAEIEVYSPVKNADRCVAIIRGFGVFVYGDTPMAAHKAAELWRQRAWNDVCKPSERVGDGKGFKDIAKEKKAAAQKAPAETEVAQ